MLDITIRDGPKPKCHFTEAQLPTFVNHEHPPLKKRPFSTINNQTLNHTLDVVLPEAAANKVAGLINDGKDTLNYARVYMKLRDIVEGDFFNQYVKSGSILMLAEGRPGIDHVYSLIEGTLRLEVGKPTYERMGLQGTPMPHEGRKHVKARYAIEINLRQPSMVTGKSGYERVLWAFKNVLNDSVTWLFYDCMGPNDGTGPIAKHMPIVRSVKPDVQLLEGVRLSAMPKTLEDGDWDRATETLEWLSMVGNLSPRAQRTDTIDPYLCRYKAPCQSDSGETNNSQSLTRFRWRGFIPAGFIVRLFLATLKASAGDWVSFTANAFDGKAITILKSGEKSIIWEYLD